MPGRLDLRPLVGGALVGLRRRRAHGEEPVDGTVRYVLFGVPLVTGAVIGALRVQLQDPGTLAAGVAVLIGALLGGFAMLGGWKERLVARDRDTEQVNLRALDEAGAHVLLSVVVSVVASVCLAVVANATTPDAGAVREWTLAVFGGVSVAALVYIAISMIIVVNLLWDAYVSATPEHRRTGV